jgi:uncharacterized protein YecE (DUF72 family)
MLSLYARAFRSVEVDSTFYAAPPEPIVKTWAERVPPGFRFSLKVPQEITHERRLRDADATLAHFVERARLLGDRLAVLLLQLPPDFEPTPAAREALEAFVPRLPAEFSWAIEFRHPRWLEPETLALLQNRGIALALVEGRWVRRERMLELAGQPTAPFAYVRWMGPDRRLTDYSRIQVDRERELALWSEALAGLRRRVRTVYGYVNNHFQGHGPASARRLQELLGQETLAPDRLREQGELF